MRLSSRTISDLAELICGGNGASGGFNWTNFPYRSSSQLTQFFSACDLPYQHDGSTRKIWVENTLKEINEDSVTLQHLPSSSMIRVIQELMDAVNYQKLGLNRNAALTDLNSVLAREAIEAYLDATGLCHIKNTQFSTTSATSKIQARPLSPAEIERRNEITAFLNTASEDEFIEELLVPLFRQLGFLRVTATGHYDKALEYGKDLWMKYQIPTGHFIYFSAQVKKEKIDAAGRDLNSNISGILAQVRMALDHPIFDPETNRKHLLDHVYIISASIITKQARALLVEHLDLAARRQIIFMDREELLDLGAITGVLIAKDDKQNNFSLNEDEPPF
ncbi:hypothetical protein NOS3756_47770 [Nostoc sp. NIES-3756]|uniref:hypothetical protein n=1 Tax=Nostoc sp. NIES-3756 TaxID=1751286 RepID=UPI00071F2617|nr:hypothetical protein [Nostoc sp. NIES-3756]BAT55784.1 hypothetical protein NOS3756_47770 [Nostoc sp. NIES-3756]